MLQFTAKVADHNHDEDTNGIGLLPNYGGPGRVLEDAGSISAADCFGEVRELLGAKRAAAGVLIRRKLKRLVFCCHGFCC